jgi:hypothetical protein
MHPNGALCPVCKAGIDRNKMIPIFSGATGNQDPRDNIPERPPPQRPPPPTHLDQQWNWPPDFRHQIVFGPSIFSTLLSMQFQQAYPAPPEGPGDTEKRLVAHILFVVGALLLAAIITM